MKTYVNGLRLFDHMAVSAYTRCWNYYFFKYVLGLSEPSFPEALVFGIMFHDGLAAWYNTGSVQKAKKAFNDSAEKYNYVENTKPFQSSSSPRTVENGLKKLALYCEVYKNDAFKAEMTELEHFYKMQAIRICNIQTNRIPNMPTIKHTVVNDVYYVTHIDCIGKLGESKAFLEHKTTSLYPGSVNVEAYTFSTQVQGYALALQDYYNLDRPCEGLLDIIFIRSADRSRFVNRYPLIFGDRTAKFFKNALSQILGDILWKEEHLCYWDVPDIVKCASWNRICEYRDACLRLPNIKSAKNLLKTMKFIPTEGSRIETIKQDPGKNKRDPNKLYYTIIR